MNAQIAACRTGERRIADLVEKYGVEGFLARKSAVLDHSHTFIRAALSPYRGKSCRAEILIEDDAASAEPMRLAVEVTIGDGTLTADFTGTEPQRANGLNCPVASTISMAHYAVQAVFAPDQLLNDGFNRAIELVLPKDSLINPRAPAAVSCRHLTEQAVADVVLKATKVDGVYSADPVKDPSATLYSHLSYDEVLERELKVMDLAAFTLARDHNMPIRVFNMNKPGALLNIVLGGAEGTLIEENKQ